MKKFGALIFDVDGTMAETEELHRRAFNESFAQFGLDWLWDVELYRQLLRVTGGKERIHHFISQHQNDRCQLSTAAIAALHRFKTVRYAELMARGGCPLRRGVADIIEAARRQGQRLAIATTTSPGNIEALLAPVFGNDWSKLFCTIVSGEDVENKKPAPDVYLRVLDDLGLGGGDCLAFEDSRNGLLAAQSAGVPVVIARSIYFGDDDFEGALEVVSEFTELGMFRRLFGNKTGLP